MRTPRAFSLVEVLIAIVVLALGLLGLAAVFPAVLSQQRRATDSVLGASSENSVTHYLEENRVLNRSSLVDPASGISGAASRERGWQLLTANLNWSMPTAGQFNAGYYHGDWSPVSNSNADTGISLDPVSGNMRIVGTAGVTAPDPDHNQPWFEIPVSQRLAPAPYTQGAQPLYVWDFVARRVASGRTPADASTDLIGFEDDSVQLAVFIRRIDTGIRRPAGVSLTDVLVNPAVAAADRRVPVAEDSINNRPTFDGVGGASSLNYSGIHGIDFDLHPYDVLPGNPKKRYDRLRLDPAGSVPQLATFAKQLRQQLVDSWGVVHTLSEAVRRRDLDPADPDYDANPPRTDEIVAYVVTPPMDIGSVTDWTNSGAGALQMRFTTQVPTSVFIVTIRTAAPRQQLMPICKDTLMRTNAENKGNGGARSLLRLAGRSPQVRCGFTLMEIVVAVGAVALVSVGLASIFDSVGKTVTGGRRLSVLNTYAGMLESQMRRDFESMTRDGFLTIRQQYVDTDGNGVYTAADRVPVSSSDLAPRGRRIDEILFFVNGQYASGRQSPLPGVQATSGVAEVWYGHGQATPALDPPGDANHPAYRKPFPVVSDRNAVAAARLGIAPTTGASDSNPNYYASNWTLLRHQTLLTKPATADAATVPPTSLVFGINPATAGGHATLRDKSTQIALQPAAASIFRSVSTYFPNLTLDARESDTLRAASDGGSNFRLPFLASGVIDIAATDLAEVRAYITSCPTRPQFVTGSFLPPPLTQFQPRAESQNDQYRYARPPVNNYVDLDRIHAWMSDAYPAESRNQQAALAANDIPKDPDDTVWGTRMRYEPESTDLLASMQLPANATSIQQLQTAEARADQLMLGSGSLVPHCSEFIVEWSFGNVDAAGQVVWHGPNRYDGSGAVAARPYPWDSQNLDRSKVSIVGIYVPNFAGLPALPSVGHPATDRLIYGFSPRGDEACLTSYFGWTDPTYDKSTVPAAPNNYTLFDADSAAWPWPRMIRVTVTLSDPLEPTIESTFQYVFTTPADPK